MWEFPPNFKATTLLYAHVEVLSFEVLNHERSNEFHQCAVWIFAAVTANTLVHTVGISVTVARF